MTNQEEWREHELDRDYNFILESVVGCKYAGELIDITNIKELVVAAYYLGQAYNPTSVLFEKEPIG